MLRSLILQLHLTLHRPFLWHLVVIMDFRPLDRMGADDQAILDAPFKPFYNIFGIKPVIVNQCVYQ